MLQLKRIQWGHLMISGSFNQLEISEIEFQNEQLRILFFWSTQNSPDPKREISKIADLRIWDFTARG